MRRAVLLTLAFLCAPACANPPPAAVLDANSLPAREETATLLHVQAPGRFALVAHSSSGAAIQLVDMLAGPGEIAGEAGAEDGRIDALLDSGTYKLRVFAGKNATGAITLDALPFHDAAPPGRLPPQGKLLSATLADLQQRGFWVNVPAPGNIRIAATGRALADLVVFREGRDLAPVPLASRIVEPETGHPLTELRAETRLEPGTYLVIAYGGKPATWADGDSASPFYIRAGVEPDLAAGWAGGTVGPSGTEVFTVPDWAGAIRLDLPQSAAAELIGNQGSIGIDAKSREPSGVLMVDPKTTPTVELRAAAGQPYTLRCIQTRAIAPKHPGTYWMSASTLGAGGDEVPPTILLIRHQTQENPRIVASAVPHVGPKRAWHTRFNLRGPTELLAQPDAGGPLALRSQGVRLSETLDPNSYVDVPGDLLGIHLTPAPGAFGVLDLTVGPPGLAAGMADPWPADPVIPLGAQSVWPGQYFYLLTEHAPGAETWLDAREIPVRLSDGPLIVTQQKGQSLTIPVALPPGETLSAGIIGPGATPPIARTARQDGGEDVTLPAPAAARTVILSRPPPPPPPEPPVQPAPAPPLPPLAAGAPAFFNLAEDETRSFALHVPQGGLYRIETTGRLQTAGDIGTRFIASLGTAEANGPGHNMRLTPWLRAGDYTVRVTAEASTGHLGIVAAPAPLLPAPTLSPGGSARDTLAAGTGRAIPIEIAADATYRITVLSQGAPFTGRLEDDQGWPLIAPGPLQSQTHTLHAGHYRLVVTPAATDQRMVAALERILPDMPITGHGPHSLAIGQNLSAVWHEPRPGDPRRTPDTYTFSLAGPAHAHISLSDGMVATLAGPGTTMRISGQADPVLPAGDWRLDLTAEGRNDLLGYTLSVTTDEIQPGLPRTLQLAATTPFTLATARVVTLTTTGRAPTRAILRAADGQVLARAGARDNDWNTAISQRLPPGAYTIEIQPGLPPGQTRIASQQQGPNGGHYDPVPPDETVDAGTDATGYAGSTETTLHLDLPTELPQQAAPPSLATLAGAGVHIFAIPPPPAGALILATAHGAGTSLVSLERQGPGGAWHTVAQGTGAQAIAAALADGKATPWRAAIWSLDGPSVPLTAAVRAIQQAPADLLSVPQGLDVAVARLTLPTPTVLNVAGPPGLLQAGFPGHAATEITGGHALPQGKLLWLLAPTPGSIATRPAGETRLTLDIPEGAHATLPGAAQHPGRISVWRADGGDGQPAFTDGPDGGAIAPSSAVLRAEAAPTLANAGGQPVMRTVLERHDLDLLPPRPLVTGLSLKIPAGRAIPVDTTGTGDLLISLTPGLAAFAGTTSGVWAPVSPITRRIAATPHLLLANLAGTDSVAGLLPVPHLGPDSLGPGAAIKRFFGAAGSFELPADAPAAAHIQVAGDASLFVRDAAGHVLAGKRVAPAPGPARVAVTHGRGLVVLWMEAPGHAPWPAIPPAAAALPASIGLAGPAMAFRIPGAGHILLHATTTAPVLLGLADGQVELFGAGAEFHRAIDAPAILRVLSPQDGPLSGTLALSAEPLRVLSDGLGQTVALPPGGTAAFAFTLPRQATIGIGVRAEPDRARVRVLNAAGHVVGEGVAQLLPQLPAGNYVLEARIPPDAPPTILRPALLGTVPRPSGPPPDVVRSYLAGAQ